jgi:hypothetical protein
MMIGWMLQCHTLGFGPSNRVGGTSALEHDNRRINHFARMRLQRRDLVYIHETAVADNIGGQDCCKAAHRVHSGNPAFRRPSINSFEFDCPPRAIHVVIVKLGSTSSRRTAASRASASRPRWASRRETAVSSRMEGVLTYGFLRCDNGLVKATKLNKGRPRATQRPV